jgi:hypothetical protein
MAYSSGSTIQASDIRSLVGNKSSATPYSNDAEATNKLAALYGVGYGTRGWGQFPPVLASPTTGATIAASDWGNMATVILNAFEHLNFNNAFDSNISDIQSVINSNSLTTGSTIAALSYDWQTNINVLDANRLGRAKDYKFSSSLTDTRTDGVSAGWRTKIYSEMVVDFGSADQARWYFNSGGFITFNAAFVATNTKGQPWQTFTTEASNILFGAFATLTGPNNPYFTPPYITSNIGYYNLTSNWSTIYSVTDLDSPNQIVVQAKIETSDTTNGANGSAIRFSYQFLDNSGTMGLIQGTMTLLAQCYVPDTPFWLPNPAIKQIVSLTGSAGPTWFEFTDTITDTRYNYDVLVAANAQPGYTTGQAIHAKIIIASTGIIGSTDTGRPAFNVPLMPVDSIIQIINYGTIAGMGGAGGQGAPSGVCGFVAGGAGQNGGPAMTLNYSTLLTNFGIIGGGGGGGGGGGSENSYIWNVNASGGGGGAGLLGGAAGATNSCGVTLGRDATAAEPGSLLTGGMPGKTWEYPYGLTWNHGVTAHGGKGGDLGQPGASGENKNMPGGSGGLPGVAITGINFLQAGSVVGDIRGTAGLTIALSGSADVNNDWYLGPVLTPNPVTSTVTVSAITSITDPITLSVSPSVSNLIGVTVSTNTTSSWTLSFAWQTNPPALPQSVYTLGTVVGTFVITATTSGASTGGPVSATLPLTVTYTFTDSTPSGGDGGGSGPQ